VPDVRIGSNGHMKNADHVALSVARFILRDAGDASNSGLMVDFVGVFRVTAHFYILA